MTTTYSDLGATIGKLVDERQKTYGSSFQKTADYLKVLFPQGINPEQYVHLGLLVRIFDKTMRVATGHYEDSYRDIGGYALLGEELVRGEVVTTLAPEAFYSGTVPEGVTPVYYTLGDNGAVIQHGEIDE